jgi:hypothetical protein
VFCSRWHSSSLLSSSAIEARYPGPANLSH